MCKDINCVANAKEHSYLSSDIASRLGLGLKNRPETQFCESRSRRFQVRLGLEGYSSQLQAYCLETLNNARMYYALVKLHFNEFISLLYLQVRNNENRWEKCEKFDKNQLGKW